MAKRQKGVIKGYKQLDNETTNKIKELGQISHDRDRIVRRLNKFMDDASESGRPLTAAQQAQINGAPAQLQALNDREQELNTSLGKVANVYNGLADESAKNIDMLLQKIDQAMNAQGAGLFTIAMGALHETKVILIDVRRHNNTFYDHQLGASSLSKAQRDAVVRTHSKLNDAGVGLRL